MPAVDIANKVRVCVSVLCFVGSLIFRRLIFIKSFGSRGVDPGGQGGGGGGSRPPPPPMKILGGGANISFLPPPPPPIVLPT